MAESSKANYILEGYYTDSNFTTPFYAEDPVTGNMNVYAKYESMGDAEALTLDSFARMDQQPDVSFRFKALDRTADTPEAAKTAVTLAVKDGSDPVEITVSVSGVYTVSAPAGSMATITFDAKGGSAVESKSLPIGGILGSLPTPTRTGYTFDGWFTDDGTFANQVDANTTVTGATTLYAKWTAKIVTVTFNTNGGVNLGAGEAEKAVMYGDTYGVLPTPERSGYGFRGWWTAVDGGTQVTTDTTVTATEDHALYAHWVELKTIPETVFTFGVQETATYDKNSHTAAYTFTPESGESYTENSFTITYTRVSDEFSGENKDAGAAPTMAGTYNVTITRAADDTYAKFDQTYTGVLVIERATRTVTTISADELSIYDSNIGMTYGKVSLSYNGGQALDLDESSEALKCGYQATSSLGTYKYTAEDGLIYDLAPGTICTIQKLLISGDLNYEDSEITVDGAKQFTTNAAPTNTVEDQFGSMDTYCASDFFDWNASEITLSAPGDLAALAYMVNQGNTFEGQTIRLSKSVDCSSFLWTPIGTDSSKCFKGTFDGDGHTISGLYSTTYGLFQAIGSGAVIQNVTLDDCYIGYKGGLIRTGIGGTTLKNCISNATINNSGASSSDRIVYTVLANFTDEGNTARPLPEKVS